jgi:hypothetical protein
MEGDVPMRKLLGFILIIGVIGTLELSLRITGGTQGAAQKNTDTLTKADRLALPNVGALMPKPSAQKKTDTNPQADAEDVALVQVMKAAIAARHGGALPKTVSDEDARAASQAAITWLAKQAAEDTDR